MKFFENIYFNFRSIESIHRTLDGPCGAANRIQRDLHPGIPFLSKIRNCFMQPNVDIVCGCGQIATDLGTSGNKPTTILQCAE